LRKTLIGGILTAGLVAGALFMGAWGATVIQQGSGGPPNLVPAATESMTVRVHGVGHTLSGFIEPTDVSATEDGNVDAHFDKTTYTPPTGIDVCWDKDCFTSVEIPKLKGVVYNTGVDVVIKADGSWEVTALVEQKQVYLGNGRYGFKGGNEIAPGPINGLTCPHNSYLKACFDCTLECAP
jgi:hypothetical protein